MNQNLYDIFYKKFDKKIYKKIMHVSIRIIFSLMRRPTTDQEDSFCHRVKIRQGIGWRKVLLDSSYGVAARVTVAKIDSMRVRQHATTNTAVS
jgi:hypothetical protein